MSFSQEWDQIYKTGGHKSVWPWSDLVSLTHRYLKGDGKGKKVLELGCGAGANIPFFLSLGMDYYGIEGSEYQAEILNKQYKDMGVQIKACDFTKEIPLEDNFDFIVDRGSVTCNSTADIKNMLDEVYRKISEEGYFIGGDWFADSHDAFRQADADTDYLDAYTCIFHRGYFSGLGAIHFFTEGQIRSLFRNFKIMELTEKKIIQHISEKTTCASWNFVARKC